MNKNFIERLEKIYDSNLDPAVHQPFTCKYFDDFIKYFEDITTELTYDEIYIKVMEVKNVISILNPSFKNDLKIFNKLMKELNSWNSKIELIQKMYKGSNNAQI